MYARKSEITHPNGDILQTPILIPSFSSKGLRFKSQKKTKIKSEVESVLKSTSEMVNETILISAYDLYFKYIPFPPGKGFTYMPQFTIIDSGGYETIEGFDLSETFMYPIRSNEWDLEKYKSVINKWNDERFSAGIVSYDNGQERRKNIKLQIRQAKKLFTEFPNFLGIFLIKSTKKNEMLDVDQVIENVAYLGDFSIIGFTEKELGSTIYDRMLNIAKLRKALDEASIDSPIHLFGSLDPITCVLYFFSGAELFDGLTWIKFAYHENLALYNQNYKVVKQLMDERESTSRSMILNYNISYLRNLQRDLEKFVDNENDFEIFNEQYRELFRSISKTLKKV